MIDVYVDEQPVLCGILKNIIVNNRLSHAYIFDSNFNSDAFDIARCFAKMVICQNMQKEQADIICQRIDNNDYIDIKVIESDGLWIKKEQLIDLQNEFSKQSFEGGKKIYIIKDAEKMNVQASNSLLKFLEEPVDDIIAILITDNVNLLLPTIISRCQVLKLRKKVNDMTTLGNFANLVKSTSFDTIGIEDRREIVDNVLSFICYVETNGLDAIIYSKKKWHDNFKDRNYNLLAIELMIEFYYDVLLFLSNSKVRFFVDKIDDVECIAKKNDIISVSKKIEILDEHKNNLKRNLNIGLFVDDFIMEMCGV